MNSYDLAIIGMGFAGYSGAIYASRYGLQNVIIGETFGGQTIDAHAIGNYPGFELISGLELMQRVQSQALKLGTQEIYEKVELIEQNPSGESFKFTITLRNSNKLHANNILLTIGMKHRILNVPGEAELYGKGVTYCATCDGFFFKGKDVAVIGGGDSAVSAALYLSDICSHVHMIVRKDKLRAEPYWMEQLQKRTNITMHFNSSVKTFNGTKTLESISLNETDTPVMVTGGFIEIGHEPYKEFTSKIGVSTDEEGYIIVDKYQRTSVPGIYAAGDSTTASNKFAQLLTAAAEAAIAAEAIANEKK